MNFRWSLLLELELLVLYSLQAAGLACSYERATARGIVEGAQGVLSSLLESMRDFGG